MHRAATLAEVRALLAADERVTYTISTSLAYQHQQRLEQEHHFKSQQRFSEPILRPNDRNSFGNGSSFHPASSHDHHHQQHHQQHQQQASSGTGEGQPGTRQRLSDAPAPSADALPQAAPRHVHAATVSAPRSSSPLATGSSSPQLRPPPSSVAAQHSHHHHHHHHHQQHQHQEHSTHETQEGNSIKLKLKDPPKDRREQRRKLKAATASKDKSEPTPAAAAKAEQPCPSCSDDPASQDQQPPQPQPQQQQQEQQQANGRTGHLSPRHARQRRRRSPSSAVSPPATAKAEQTWDRRFISSPFRNPSPLKRQPRSRPEERARWSSNAPSTVDSEQATASNNHNNNSSKQQQPRSPLHEDAHVSDAAETSRPTTANSQASQVIRVISASSADTTDSAPDTRTEARRHEQRQKQRNSMNAQLGQAAGEVMSALTVMPTRDLTQEQLGLVEDVRRFFNRVTVMISAGASLKRLQQELTLTSQPILAAAKVPYFDEVAAKFDALCDLAGVSISSRTRTNPASPHKADEGEKGSSSVPASPSEARAAAIEAAKEDKAHFLLRRIMQRKLANRGDSKGAGNKSGTSPVKPSNLRQSFSTETIKRTEHAAGGDAADNHGDGDGADGDDGDGHRHHGTEARSPRRDKQQQQKQKQEKQEKQKTAQREEDTEHRHDHHRHHKHHHSDHEQERKHKHKHKHRSRSPTSGKKKANKRDTNSGAADGGDGGEGEPQVVRLTAAALAANQDMVDDYCPIGRMYKTMIDQEDQDEETADKGEGHQHKHKQHTQQQKQQQQQNGTHSGQHGNGEYLRDGDSAHHERLSQEELIAAAVGMTKSSGSSRGRHSRLRHNSQSLDPGETNLELTVGVNQQPQQQQQQQQHGDGSAHVAHDTSNRRLSVDSTVQAASSLVEGGTYLVDGLLACKLVFIGPLDKVAGACGDGNANDDGNGADNDDDDGGFLHPPGILSSRTWCGVIYHHKRHGSCDGTINGYRYFVCDPGYGDFVHPSRLKTVTQPKEGFMEQANASTSDSAEESDGETHNDRDDNANGGDTGAGAGGAVQRDVYAGKSAIAAAHRTVAKVKGAARGSAGASGNMKHPQQQHQEKHGQDDVQQTSADASSDDTAPKRFSIDAYGKVVRHPSVVLTDANGSVLADLLADQPQQQQQRGEKRLAPTTEEEDGDVSGLDIDGFGVALLDHQQEQQRDKQEQQRRHKAQADTTHSHHHHHHVDSDEEHDDYHGASYEYHHSHHKHEEVTAHDDAQAKNSRGKEHGDAKHESTPHHHRHHHDDHDDNSDNDDNDEEHRHRHQHHHHHHRDSREVWASRLEQVPARPSSHVDADAAAAAADLAPSDTRSHVDLLQEIDTLQHTLEATRRESSRKDKVIDRLEEKLNSVRRAKGLVNSSDEDVSDGAASTPQKKDKKKKKKKGQKHKAAGGAEDVGGDTGSEHDSDDGKGGEENSDLPWSGMMDRLRCDVDRQLHVVDMLSGATEETVDSEVLMSALKAAQTELLCLRELNSVKTAEKLHRDLDAAKARIKELESDLNAARGELSPTKHGRAGDVNNMSHINGDGGVGFAAAAADSVPPSPIAPVNSAASPLNLHRETPVSPVVAEVDRMVRSSLERSRRVEESFRARLLRQQHLDSVLSPLGNKENAAPGTSTPHRGAGSAGASALRGLGRSPPPPPPPLRWNTQTMEEKDREIEQLRDKLAEAQSTIEELKGKNLQTSLLLGAERKQAEARELHISSFVAAPSFHGTDSFATAKDASMLNSLLAMSDDELERLQHSKVTTLKSTIQNAARVLSSLDAEHIDASLLNGDGSRTAAAATSAAAAAAADHRVPERKPGKYEYVPIAKSGRSDWKQTASKGEDDNAADEDERQSQGQASEHTTASSDSMRPVAMKRIPSMNFEKQRPLIEADETDSTHARAHGVRKDGEASGDGDDHSAKQHMQHKHAKHDDEGREHDARVSDGAGAHRQETHEHDKRQQSSQQQQQQQQQQQPQAEQQAAGQQEANNAEATTPNGSAPTESTTPNGGVASPFGRHQASRWSGKKPPRQWPPAGSDDAGGGDNDSTADRQGGVREKAADSGTASEAPSTLRSEDGLDKDDADNNTPSNSNTANNSNDNNTTGNNSTNTTTTAATNNNSAAATTTSAIAAGSTASAAQRRASSSSTANAMTTTPTAGMSRSSSGRSGDIGNEEWRRRSSRRAKSDMSWRKSTADEPEEGIVSTPLAATGDAGHGDGGSEPAATTTAATTQGSGQGGGHVSGSGVGEVTPTASTTSVNADDSSPEPSPAKKGFLHFRSKSGLFARRKWSQRFLEVDGSKFILAKGEERKPEVVAEINQNWVVDVEGKQDAAHIRVVTHERTFFFKSPSKSDALEWASCIRRARESGAARKRQVVEVRVQRDGDTPFGFSIAGGTDSANKDFTGIFVANVKPDSIVASVLFRSDQLLTVNGHTLDNKTNAEANKLLSEARGTVVFQVARKRRRQESRTPSNTSLNTSTPAPASPAATTAPTEPTSHSSPATVSHQEQQQQQQQQQQEQEQRAAAEEDKTKKPPTPAVEVTAPPTPSTPATDASATPSTPSTPSTPACGDEDAKRAEMRRQLSARRMQRKQTQKKELDDVLRVIYELPEE